MTKTLDCYMAFRYTASGSCKIILAALDRENPAGNGTAVTSVFPGSTQQSTDVANYMTRFFQRAIQRSNPEELRLHNGETAGREPAKELLSYTPFNHRIEGAMGLYLDNLLRLH